MFPDKQLQQHVGSLENTPQAICFSSSRATQKTWYQRERVSSSLTQNTRSKHIFQPRPHISPSPNIIYAFEHHASTQPRYQYVLSLQIIQEYNNLIQNRSISSYITFTCFFIFFSFFLFFSFNIQAFRSEYAID